MRLIATILLTASLAIAADQRALVRVDADGWDVDTNQRQSIMPQADYVDCVLAMPFSKDRAGEYIDFSTSHNDGAQTNASARPSWTNANGGAYDFDGVDDFIEVADDDSLDMGTSSFSLAAWINTSSDANYPRILCNRAGVGSPITSFFLQQAAGNLRMRLYDSSTNKYEASGDASTDVATGAWAHIAATVDRVADVVTFYVNGIADGTGDISAITESLSTSNPMLIGVRDDGSPDGFFDGLIDDARIYDRALTSNEVFTIHANTTGVH